MKATGIVRRVDDLGRVVIPREIRQSLGIHDGDPLEFFVDKGNIVLTPYKPNERLTESIVTDFKNLANADERKKVLAELISIM